MKASYAFNTGAILLMISVVSLIRGFDIQLNVPDPIYNTDYEYTDNQVSKEGSCSIIESREKKQNIESEFNPVNKSVPSDDSIRYVEFPNSYSCPILDIDILKLRHLADKEDGVTVAVLDTGIDKNHDDLIGRVIGEINLTSSTTTGDIDGHGTHVAGIIAADDSHGVKSIAPGINLLNVKIANDRGRCESYTLEQGVIWAVQQGANVINISVEIAEYTERLERVINYAWDNGVLIISAAGNNGANSAVFPARYENTIAVTALKGIDSLAPLANYGDWVDIAAPGFEVYSTLPQNNYGYKTGTSFATAYVSGVAAMLYNVVMDANEDSLLNDDVKKVIVAGNLQL